MKVKSYLHYEGARNRKYADLYARMIKCAYGASNEVIVGHHLNFEDGGDLSTENEIPAADTLLFDHDIMHACFGADAIMVMRALAETRVDYRDDLLIEFVKMYGHEDIKAVVKSIAPVTPPVTVQGNYSEEHARAN